MLRIKRAPFQAILILTLRLNGNLRIGIVLFSNIIPRRCLQADVASYLFIYFLATWFRRMAQNVPVVQLHFLAAIRGRYLSILF